MYAESVNIPTLLIQGALSNVVTQDEVDDSWKLLNMLNSLMIVLPI